jgi:hypothetical protein
MSTISQSVASTVHTPEEILAHPRFAAARAAFVDAVLALHEGDRFTTRLLIEAGVLVLIKLIQMSTAGGGKGLSYSDLGVRFGVSRTHVRLLLEDAAQHGDVSLSGRGGRLVELTPSMLDAFDRFVAAAMSGHDMLYKLARERMANEPRQPDS